VYLRTVQPIADQPAFLTGLSGLAQATAAKPQLSAGSFGRAVSHNVGVPVKAVRLLRLSARFRRMAGVLDKAYVEHPRWIALQAKNDKLKLGRDGVIQGNIPSLKGRRVLYVGFNDAGSLFIRGSSPDASVEWDMIRIKGSLDSDDTLEWVRHIAHEAAHAEARVKATGKAPVTLVQRVQAGIRDEMNARTVERQVVKEICATSQGKGLPECPVPPPPVQCEAERDWFPSAQRLTYLEQFVLGAARVDALQLQQLSDADIKAIETKVRAIDLSKAAPKKSHSLLIELLRGTPVASLTAQFPVIQSAVGRATFVLRIVDVSWRDLQKRAGSTDRWPAAREARLQRHARLFFDSKITYTKCP
jgi:hypothetical protein